MTCLKTYLNRTHEKSWVRKARYFIPYCRAQKKLNRLHANLHEGLLIVAFPRSGSTWVQEVIAQLGNFFTLFEPLSNHFGAPDIRAINWSKKIDSSTVRSRVMDVLTGSYFTPWSNLLYSFNSSHPNRLLIKSITLINQLDWLVEEVPFKHPPLVLVRHPIDLYKSQRTNFKNQGVQWRRFQSLFPEESEMIDPLGASFKTTGVLDVAALSIQMKSLFQLQSREKIYVFKYEDLVANPREQFQKIVELYNLNSERLDKTMKKVKNPSRSDFGSMYTKDSKKQLEKWKNSMKPNELKRCEHIMDLLGNPYY